MQLFGGLSDLKTGGTARVQLQLRLLAQLARRAQRRFRTAPDLCRATYGSRAAVFCFRLFLPDPLLRPAQQCPQALDVVPRFGMRQEERIDEPVVDDRAAQPELRLQIEYPNAAISGGWSRPTE